MNREAFDRPSKAPEIVLIGTSAAESIRMLGLSAALARISEHGPDILTIPDMNKGDFVNPIPINPPKESLTAADTLAPSTDIPFTRTTTDDYHDKILASSPNLNRKQRRRMDRGQGRTATFKRSEYAALNENKAAEAEKERKKKKQTAKMKKKARR